MSTREPKTAFVTSMKLDGSSSRLTSSSVFLISLNDIWCSKALVTEARDVAHDSVCFVGGRQSLEGLRWAGVAGQGQPCNPTRVSDATRTLEQAHSGVALLAVTVTVHPIQDAMDVNIERFALAEHNAINRDIRQFEQGLMDVCVKHHHEPCPNEVLPKGKFQVVVL